MTRGVQSGLQLRLGVKSWRFVGSPLEEILGTIFLLPKQETVPLGSSGGDVSNDVILPSPDITAICGLTCMGNSGVSNGAS